jgi:hypothetical protein
MAKRLFKNIIRLFIPVYKLESDSNKILYAGYSSKKKHYYARLLLDKNIKSTFFGMRFFWQIPDLLKSHKSEMVIAEISHFAFDYFRKYYGYIIPDWASIRINIDRPISDIINSISCDYKDVTRRIRKYNLTYEILTDKESFTLFNDRFYVPYITKRHGEEAFIEDLNVILKSAQPPILMAIREDGNIVGMSLIRKTGDILNYMRLGLVDGNEEYRRHGVIGAIYYFGMIEGQKMGCKSIDLGGTHPFLNDGLTKYKLGMGGEFHSDFSLLKEYLWLGLNENSASAKELLCRNPFMHLDREFRMVRCGF